MGLDDYATATLAGLRPIEYTLSTRLQVSVRVRARVRANPNPNPNPDPSPNPNRRVHPLHRLQNATAYDGHLVLPATEGGDGNPSPDPNPNPNPNPSLA